MTNEQDGAVLKAAEAEQDLICPFCGEGEFDRAGLKIHYVHGHCEPYERIRLTVRLSAPATPREKDGCNDCGAPYGKDGWVDVVIPGPAWHQIAPDGGILCFRCMTKRLEAKGMRDVPVTVCAGPYKDDNEQWRLIGMRQAVGLAAAEVAALDEAPSNLSAPASPEPAATMRYEGGPPMTLRECMEAEEPTAQIPAAPAPDAGFVEAAQAVIDAWDYFGTTKPGVENINPSIMRLRAALSAAGKGE